MQLSSKGRNCGLVQRVKIARIIGMSGNKLLILTVSLSREGQFDSEECKNARILVYLKAFDVDR
jgi:hypothetical protein